MDGDQSIQPQHSHLALAATPRQATNFDVHGKLGLLLRAFGEAREPYPAGAEGTA